MCKIGKRQLKKHHVHHNREVTISGYAHKVTQDALVASGVLKNDGWANIVGMQDSFFVDARNPRIEVIIREVEISGK